MLNRRDIMKLQAGLVAFYLWPNGEVLACPPPKYKKDQLVELLTGARLFVVSSKVFQDQNLYSLSYLKDGEVVVELFEREIKNVAK